MEHYGIRGSAIKWFKSYLHNRKQFVMAGGVMSSLHHITHGVPAGSILGPLLFLLYVNDLPRVQSDTKFILYADDTTVLIPCDNSMCSLKYIQDCVNTIVDWFAVNMLALNVKKTNAMLFTLNTYCDIPPVVVNGEAIYFVQSVKFLGCFLDPHMRWHVHIDHVCRSISRGIAMLRATRVLFSRFVKIMIYYAFVYSYLSYCLSLWGSAADVYTNDVIVIQKRAVRLVANVCSIAHSRPLAFNFNILLFNELYQFKCACIVFKLLNSPHFQMFHNLNLHNNASGRGLRNMANLTVQYSRTCVRQKSFVCSAIKIWNSVPIIVRNISSFVIFKRQLRALLLANYM